ncbi:hypothetical protein [Inhella gelatinilytica]|uniref:Uncharacterized protein n=1 Tax=Inhella gelatinilytica TaxID=2795030 RepID=A0A931NF73_9BURK|nr:hypothetical protein [Inhella gelatinilytica]MBH9553970.1 hypothetical protein [Inhella gelatinilytica]
MTTLSERISALKAAGLLLEQLALAPHGTEASRVGHWYLQAYPQEVDFSRRLVDYEAYRLLLAVRRIERVRALIDDLQSAMSGRWADADPAWIAEAQRIAPHFPRRHELVEAVRSPHNARAWADFYLDRPTQERQWRQGVGLIGCIGLAAQRREALRRLPYVIGRLEKDEGFPPLGVAEARRVLRLLPSQGEMGRRLSGLSNQRFHEIEGALEQGCQLIEAVVAGTLPASARPRALARAIGRHLPHSETFPLYGLGPYERPIWLRWLFLSKRPFGRQRPSCEVRAAL